MNDLTMFYGQIINCAPLSELLNTLCHELSLDYALITDTHNNIIAKAGNVEQGANTRKFPLSWNKKNIGSLHLSNMLDEEIPGTVLQSLAGELYMATKKERSIEAELWQAVNCGHFFSAAYDDNPNALPILPANGEYILFFMDTDTLEEHLWPAAYDALADNMPCPAAASAFESGGIIMLYKCGETSAALADALSGLLQRFGAPGALSEPFDGKRLFQQLSLIKLVLRAGRRLYPEQLFFRFEAFASFALFLASQQNMNLGNYLSEEVLEIIHHDYEKNSELSRSLYVYLFYFMDLKTAAQEISIHRNTLDYQIKKINQILGSLPDAQKRFEMMCTYGMLAMEDD